MSRRAGVLALAAAVALLAVASPAQAQTAIGQATGRPVPWTAMLALAAGGLYLAVRLLLDRVGSRVLIVSGVEHVALGVLLGPSALALGLFSEPTALLPFAALVTGWVGLSCGSEFNLRVLSDPPRGGPRLGLMVALASGALVTLAGWLFFSSESLGRVASYDAWLSAGMVGAASAAASNGPLNVLARRYELGDAMGLLIRRATRFANLAALMGFGLLFCIFHQTFAVTDRPLSAVEFAVVAMGLGALLGLVFAPFLGRTETVAGRSLSLMAMVLFASGAAFWLELSPLWVALVMGAVLVNTTSSNEALVTSVRAANGPVRLGLLVLAGAFWSPPAAGPAVAATGGLVVLRLVGRLIGSWLAARTMAPLRGDLGRGLMGQGTVAVAIALSFRLHYDGPVVDVAYTAVLGSVLVHDVLAPWILRGLLIDAGEVRGEAGARG